jgi:DnaK suppressor protein
LDQEVPVNEDEGRELLRGERARVEQLLQEQSALGGDDRSAANEPGDRNDSAEPLTRQQSDDAVAGGLRERLDAIGRAEERLDGGTFGRSIQSGDPIPDDRLRADPTAELTVEEANQASGS